MSEIVDRFHRFRRNRIVNVVISLFFLLGGLYEGLIQSGTLNIVLAVLLVVVGVLGLYNQILGEPVTRSVKERF